MRAVLCLFSKITWLRGLLNEVEFSLLDPTPRFADNTNAIKIVANPAKNNIDLRGWYQWIQSYLCYKLGIVICNRYIIVDLIK